MPDPIGCQVEYRLLQLQTAKQAQFLFDFAQFLLIVRPLQQFHFHNRIDEQHGRLPSQTLQDVIASIDKVYNQAGITKETVSHAPFPATDGGAIRSHTHQRRRRRQMA